MMETLRWVLYYAGIVLFAVIAYEALRAFVVGWLAKRLRRRIHKYVRERSVRVDKYKLTSKLYVKAEVLSDPVLARHIADYADKEKIPAEEVREQVEGWLDEIIPAFNVVSYYQIAVFLARTASKSIYDVVIDREQLQKIESQIPEGSVAIYLSNHRSNADYVLLTYALMRSVAISYAVGEWARVFPLDVLFRSFGSYFVRRGFKNPLYHKVLERYVQLVSLRGVTQAIFPEGGLSRDGFLRKPKLGLLDYICRILLEPNFNGDVVFVPIGINFDHVLEDKNLVREKQDKEAAPSFLMKLIGFFVWLVKFPFLLLFNLFRVLSGRTRRYGYAAVSAGAPISLKEWISKQPENPLGLPRAEREAKLRGLAEAIMFHIEKTVPVTPVPLVALALENCGEGCSLSQVEKEVAYLRAEAQRMGFPLVEGREFLAEKAGKKRLEAEREDRRPELLSLEEGMIEGDSAKVTAKLGIEHLTRRKLIVMQDKKIMFDQTRRDILAYYANSLDHIRRATKAVASSQGNTGAEGVEGRRG
jgi:glycerol-3-phosphate O-acyltransferase